MKKWWVVYFPAKFLEHIEKAIEEEEFDIIWYCPRMKVSHAYKGLIKVREVPMFFNYMFWYYDPLILTPELLKPYFPYKLVSFKGVPCSVSENVISHVKNMEAELAIQFDGIRTDSKYLAKYIDKTIAITDGPFCGTIGTVKSIRKAGVLDIEIIVFNRPVIVDISVDYVELLKS